MTGTEFADALAAITSVLGIAAESVFGMFAGAQQIVGIIELAALVISIILMCLVVKATWKPVSEDFKDNDGNWKDGDGMFMAYFIIVVIAFVTFLISFAVLSNTVVPSVLRIMCPEYMAAKEIIGLVMA